MNKYNSNHSFSIYQALKIFPSSLQEAILKDSSFCEENNVDTDTQIVLGCSEHSFSRATLFQVIREIYRNSSNSKICDSNDKEWSISRAEEDKSLIYIETDNIQLKTKNFWPLINDIDTRISIFEYKATQRNMSKVDVERWMHILSKEEVDDIVVGDITFDLELTPFFIESMLREEFNESENKLHILAPDNTLYYERLIGVYAGSLDINQYAINELSNHFKNRVNSDFCFLDILLCAHSAISERVSENLANEEKYLSYAKTALKTKNPIALIGFFEIGLSKFVRLNESLLQELFECLCSPEVLEALTLLCSMTIFIEGELARLSFFKNKPPFYRRLASISQASLITNVALEKGSKFLDIEGWAMKERGLLFYCQTFIDMREEPRWLPGYLCAEQLRNELLGRMYNACQRVNNHKFCQGILEKITNQSFFQFNAFLPGPLEGNTELGELPDFVRNRLDEGIQKQISLMEFGSLINSAQIWKLDEKYIQHALMLLDTAKHQLREAPTKESIAAMLNGLAKVAALTRSKQLAASVMILSRIYRDYLNVNNEPDQILGMGLVASAAFSDKEEWAEYIGQWLTELAYLPLEVSAISSLKAMLEQLCILEPFLYYTCGRPLEILKCLERQ